MIIGLISLPIFGVFYNLRWARQMRWRLLTGFDIIFTLLSLALVEVVLVG